MTFGLMRCLECKSPLELSGVEPQRHVCSGCGQHYIAVLQLVPVGISGNVNKALGADAGFSPTPERGSSDPSEVG